MILSHRNSIHYAYSKNSFHLISVIHKTKIEYTKFPPFILEFIKGGNYYRYN